MSKTPTADEQPKKKVARRVIATKRLYFMPEHGISVEAESADAAVKKVRTAIKSVSEQSKPEKEQEEGDA